MLLTAKKGTSWWYGIILVLSMGLALADPSSGDATGNFWANRGKRESILVDEGNDGLDDNDFHRLKFSPMGNFFPWRLGGNSGFTRSSDAPMAFKRGFKPNNIIGMLLSRRADDLKRVDNAFTKSMLFTSMKTGKRSLLSRPNGHIFFSKGLKFDAKRGFVGDNEGSSLDLDNVAEVQEPIGAFFAGRGKRNANEQDPSYGDGSFYAGRGKRKADGFPNGLLEFYAGRG